MPNKLHWDGPALRTAGARGDAHHGAPGAAVSWSVALLRTTALRVAVALLLVLASACARTSPVATDDAVRVLFVGNSLTYVGNLPAVFDALARANGRTVRSDMIVRGGATLSNHVQEGAVESTLAARRYDYVVLQERGGDFMCDFQPADCGKAAEALGVLKELVQQHGARPVLLGTYQFEAIPSAELVRAESSAAANTGMPYVSVSNHLQAGLASQPAFQWFFRDGGHPGPDLILMDSLLLFRAVFGEQPKNTGFSVKAPLHEPSARFPTGVVPAAEPTHGGSPNLTYSEDRVSSVANLLREKP